MKFERVVKYMDNLCNTDYHFGYSYIKDENNFKGYLFNVTRLGHYSNKSFWSKDVKDYSGLKSILYSQC